MTQFLVVTGTHTDLSPPLGILAVQPSDALLTTLATHRIFQDYRGPCAKIVDPASGEADPLFAAMLDPTNPCGSKLLHWLASLAAQGCGIAAWARTDASQLPQYTTWQSFLHAVQQSSAEFSPDVYAVLQPTTARATL